MTTPRFRLSDDLHEPVVHALSKALVAIAAATPDPVEQRALAREAGLFLDHQLRRQNDPDPPLMPDEEPVIEVIIRGGTADDITWPPTLAGAAHIVVQDYDTDDADPDRLTLDGDGERYYRTEFTHPALAELERREG